MLDGYDTRSSLGLDQRLLLENQILPTAVRWIRDYPRGSVLHRQGLKTLLYWGEVEE